MTNPLRTANEKNRVDRSSGGRNSPDHRSRSGKDLSASIDDVANAGTAKPKETDARDACGYSARRPESASEVPILHRASRYVHNVPVLDSQELLQVSSDACAANVNIIHSADVDLTSVDRDII